MFYCGDPLFFGHFFVISGIVNMETHPDRPFHSFSAPKSADRQILRTSSETLRGLFSSFKFAIGPVGIDCCWCCCCQQRYYRPSWVGIPTKQFTVKLRSTQVTHNVETKLFEAVLKCSVGMYKVWMCLSAPPCREEIRVVMSGFSLVKCELTQGRQGSSISIEGIIQSWKTYVKILWKVFLWWA